MRAFRMGDMAVDIETLVAWFGQDRSARLPRQKAIEDFYRYLPRTAFLKTLKANARVLDVGAGDGSLELFRNWLEPSRPDLAMYAYSLERGNRFDAYAGYELGNWENGPPEFGGMAFDAIIACHFIEHVSDPHAFLDWAGGRLASGGRVYVEWPSPQSLRLPPRTALEARGVNVIISNFHDDSTHRQLPDRAELLSTLEQSGWLIDQQGVVKLPFFEEELLARCDAPPADPVAKLSAFWSKTRWAQYFIASKPDQP